MFMLVGLLIALAVPAVISVAAAFALPTLAPGWSLRRRSAAASLLAGMLPISVPLFAAITDPANPAVISSVVAILFAGLFIALVIGLPIALLVGRRRSGRAPIDPAAFD